MSAFDYIISVTGDCSHVGAGAISIQPIGGTPPYTVEWVNPSLPPIDYSITGASTRTNLFYGTYAVRLNDSSLPVNGEFVVNIPVSSGVCCSIVSTFPTTCNLDNGSVSATSSSDYSVTTFNLLDDSDNVLQTLTSSQDLVVFTGLSASTYSIMALDLGGCTGKSQNFIIEDSPAVDFGFYVVPNSTCSTTSNPLGKLYVTGLTGTPPFQYLWSNGETGSTITGLTSGAYAVQITDADGCTKSKNVSLGDVDPLGFVLFEAVNPSCFSSDGSLTIYISGGTAPYYYSASTGNVEISYQQSFTLNNITAGSYRFSITDAGLCTISEGTSITTPESIGSVTVLTTNSTCSSTDGSIQLSVFQGLPPFTYTLVYPDSSTQSTTLNSPNFLFSNLSTGTYEVFVSDQGSCTFTQTVYIIATDTFTISTAITGTTCNQNNGSIYVSKTTGGTEPFNYFLDGIPQILDTSLTSTTFNNVSSGSHVVTVSDAEGCNQSQTVYISSSEPLEFSLYKTDCLNGNDGIITAFISSGTPPFTFNWSNNILGNPQNITVNNLTAGTYSLTITDSTGCYATQTTSISCVGEKIGYYNFPVGSQELVVNSFTSFGLLQMLNDGFRDLTDGNPNCILNSTLFICSVEVEPVGLSAATGFYTGTTLVDIPSDEIWTSAVKLVLESVPGVSSVTIDPTNNQIIIQKSLTNTFLDNQIINFDIGIEYDISC